MCKQKKEKEFTDPPNTAVFTTKFVIEDSKTITYVTHDADDGAWQFFSNDDFDKYEDVVKIVGLQEIVNLDSSVLEISDMPEGHYASRNDGKDKWVTHKQE